MSSRPRYVGLYAAFAAVAAVLISPLLAMSYFATSDGAEQLENGTVSAWADPGRDLVGGLLYWASADRVYATYLQAFALIFPAVFLCARSVRARRPADVRRSERWGWRIALFGYGLTSVGLVAAFFVLFNGDAAGAALNLVFLGLLVPGMLISVIGSTVLGIALLRSEFSPKLTAWLLTLALPAMLVIPEVLGHNSLGLLAMIVAWGIAGFQLWRSGATTDQGDEVLTMLRSGSA